MNRTLNDIERTVSESKSKMKSDFERSLRGLNFGKLYLKNGEYENALKYVKSYLSVRPNSSEGHKLLAQIYEAIGDDDTALQNYRKALDLKKNSNENYLSSIQSPMSTKSMSEINRNIEHNLNPSLESTPIRKETPLIIIKEKTSENNDNKSHPCSTCSNQTLLNKIAKQNDNLMESHKIILDILKQNNCRVNDIQNQMIVMSEALNNLTDSQNLMKDTLYEYMANEENEGFDDYLLDDKENESLDPSALLGISNQSNQWHSSGLQLMQNIDESKPLSELFKPAANSWQCDACYVQNNGSDTVCVSCTTPKPGHTAEPSVAEPPKTSFSFGNTQPFSFKAPISNTNTGFTFGFANTEPNPSADSNTIFSNTNFKFGNTSFTPSLSTVSTPPQFGLQTTKPNETKSPQNMFSLNSNSIESKTNSFAFGLTKNFDFDFPKFGEQQPLTTTNTITTTVSEEKPNNEREEENTSLNESHVEPSNADNIYFQPVVPLPPKIEVKTGEESENVLYSCRSRLFRFCDGEWKERGVGELKILESRDSNKIRLLMRRDTIFKVCLNQSVTQDLKLELKEDKKSITWSAIDYSEDTPNPQIFLLRLKNAENAELFLNAFESAKSTLTVDNSPKKGESFIAKQNKTNTEDTSLKASVESSVSSSKDNDIEIIYQKMPESEDILKKVRQLKLPLNFFDYENMEPCPGCRGCQDEQISIFSTPEPKPTEVTETPESIQDNLFHSVIASANISQTDWKKNSSGQLSWLSNAPTPIFSGPRSPSQDDDTIAANPDIYFKPLIPLPDLVEVKTGEEDETPIYCQRAKLFRFDPQTKEWKERGIGDFKILKHNSKNRFRMVLRRDQILKIACNHYITSLMSLKPMNTSETAVCWYAVDYTDGNGIEEQFALKFKNKDILQAFIKLFNECKSSLDQNDGNNSYSEQINGTDAVNDHQN